MECSRDGETAQKEWPNLVPCFNGTSSSLCRNRLVQMGVVQARTGNETYSCLPVQCPFHSWMCTIRL